ncbi:MAG: tyrosyl-tRNA synthetase [Candidatus Tokpelaia sp. JSC085]|nr:MAG: tyrosyl-tRNA synthetase [Candidatus Tokpelaia sp. JSC085]
MSHFKSDFLHIMEERSFIHQLSDAQELDNLFMKETVTGYIGFDPTAKSLHAGSLIQIMMLYWMQKTGHKPIVLLGGATSMIGDPSFKKAARKSLTEESITQNIAEIQKIFSRYLNFENSTVAAIMVNNADWLRPLNYLEFLFNVGRHFSVNRMLSFDSVKMRLDRQHSLSFLEFNYMILQAYDFIELNRNYGVRLQLGGSDQWGNILNGIELGHRMGTPQLYALTSPLLTTASGTKMGKSLNGAAWLNADMLCPYEFWQYWRNVKDVDVLRFLKLYTTLPMEEIARLEKLQGTEINEVKKILATEVTVMLHGRQAAEAAAETACKTFDEGKLHHDLPSINIPVSKIKEGLLLPVLLVKMQLAKSNTEARRYIQGCSIKVNDQLIKDEKRIINASDIDQQCLIKISLGKKKHCLVKII